MWGLYRLGFASNRGLRSTDVGLVRQNRGCAISSSRRRYGCWPFSRERPFSPAGRSSLMRYGAILRLVFLTLALPVHLVAQATPSSSRDNASLTPGDSVRIVVWRRPEM